MRRPNATVLTSCCLFAALAFPRSAAADQITITGGFMQMQVPQGQLSLVGERGFSLEARPQPINGFWAPWTICSGECGPGITVSLAGGWSASAVSGQLTFEGLTYNDLGGGDDLAPQATVIFDGSFVTPPLSPTAVLTAPFVFSGSFSIPTLNGATHTLTGAGIATISLHEYSSAFWNVDSVRYEFASPQPVPEPGTMFLFGFGAMMMARRLNSHDRSRGGKV